ncbi:MAG: lysophospholipid acyltransferase family protein [Planctomycetota bacterium]
MRTSGPYATALRGARAAAALAPELMPRLTATVRENLRLAFGRSEERLVRAIYRHFAEASVDLLFFRRLFDPTRFEDHFHFTGGALEHYRRTGATAAVFVTGHFGNWELFGAAFRHVGIPLAPIVRPPASGWLARRLERFRRAEGQETIPKRNALPLALKALRRGMAVAFLMDQAAGRHGIAVPFFDRPAQTLTAPAALALKTGAPLYAGYSTRLGPGVRYRCHAEVVPVEGDVESLTRRLNAILEGYVRACPEQWWWFHQRFKPPRSARLGARLTPAGLPLPQ